MKQIYTLEPVEKYQQNDFAHLAFEEKQDIPELLMREDGVVNARIRDDFDYFVEVIWLNDERSDYYIEEKELVTSK